jgi:hypothetical protein
MGLAHSCFDSSVRLSVFHPPSSFARFDRRGGTSGKANGLLTWSGGDGVTPLCLDVFYGEDLDGTKVELFSCDPMFIGQHFERFGASA